MSKLSLSVFDVSFISKEVRFLDSGRVSINRLSQDYATKRVDSGVIEESVLSAFIEFKNKAKIF